MQIVDINNRPRRTGKAAQWRRAARFFICLPWNLAACLCVRLWPSSPHSVTPEKVTPEPPYVPLSLRNDSASAQLQSKLLNLPAELRSIIWKHLLGEKHIALYYRNGRIAYEFLEDEGPDEVSNITPAVVQAVHTNYAANLHVKRERTNVLAVFQSCQLVYRETIDMLYESNTFAMLHNTVLIDFRRAALVSHLSRIRSLHIHFQFRELCQHGSLYAGADDLLSPWSIETFTTSASSPSIARAIQSLPILERLSVFIQGPLTTETTYRRICWSLRSIRHDMKSLNFMMVRFPRPFPDHGYQMRTQWRNQDPRDLVKQVLRREEELEGFRIVQPPVELAQDVYDMADSDIESEWRVGNIYMECKGVENGFATRSYAVLRPEKETDTYRPDLEAEPNCYLMYPKVPVIEHNDPEDLYGSGYRALNWPPRLDGQT